MSEMTDELLVDARERMAKSVQATNTEFGSVRTGRASPALLDRIVVDYYGAPTPLRQLATISAPEARLLTVQPYDQSSIRAIEQRRGRSARPHGAHLVPDRVDRLVHAIARVVDEFLEEPLAHAAAVRTTVPTRSPHTIRSMFRSSSMLKT